MLRLYFDTNVYSNILDGVQYPWFERVVKGADKEFIIFYSQAHIDDFHQDKSSRRDDRLKLLGEFAKDNFLQEDIDKSFIVNKLVMPLDAYKYFKPDDSPLFAEFDDLLKSDSLVSQVFAPLKNQIIDLGEDVENQLLSNREEYSVYKDLGITKRFYSFEEWMATVGDMYEIFKNEPRVLKNIRNLSRKYLEVDRLNIHIDDINFDEKLAESVLGKRYKDLVSDHLKLQNEDQRSLFNEVMTGFTLLNFLGLDRESNRKFKYTNTINDSQHCYFAGVSDIVISDDIGFVNKCKFIYSYYNMDIKVLTTKEFNKFLDDYFVIKPKDEDELIQNILYDYENSLITIPQIPDLKNNQIEHVRKIPHRYFHLANRISEVEKLSDDTVYFFLYRRINRFLKGFFYKELESIIRSLNEILGEDDDGKNEFLESEIDDLDNDLWSGRYWTGEKTDYAIQINTKTNRIIFQVGPFKK